jgi:tetratricopeptide (TPR) repeat protein
MTKNNRPMTTLETFRQRLAAGGGDSLAADLETAIVARRSVRGEHREWALLCEQAGLMSLAFSEFQLALRDDRDDPVAGFHLAQLYRERGDTSRALGLLDRLLQQQPANESWLTSYVEILAEDGAASPLAEQVLQRALEAGLPSDAAQRLRRTTRPGNRPSAASPPAEPRRNWRPATPTASASAPCSPAAKASMPANGRNPAARAAIRRSTNR